MAATGYLARSATGRTITESGGLPWIAGDLDIAGGGGVTPTITSVGVGGNTGTTAATVTFTPVAGRLYLFLFESLDDGGSAHPTITPSFTAGGGNFVAAPASVDRAADDDSDSGGWQTTMELLQAVAVASPSGTTTVSTGTLSDSSYTHRLRVLEVADSTTIAQSVDWESMVARSNDNNASEQSFSIAAPASTSLVVVFVTTNEDSGAGSMAPHSGWTELYESWDSLNLRSGAYTISGTTGTTVYVPANTSGYGNWSSVAIEITEAGGTDTPLSVSGTIGSAGAAFRSVAKNAGGTAAPAGTVAKAAAKTIVGTTPAAGALANATAKTTAGALTPAGVLVRTASKALAAVAATAGTLVRVIGKTTAGAVAPAGTVAKDTAKPLAGGITPSGAYSVVRSVLLSFAGTIAAAGALVRAIGKTTTGTASSAGDSSRATTRTTTGTITPAGSVAKATAQQLASSIVAAGAVAKAVGLSLASVVGTAGTIARTIGKVIAGTLAGVGSLVTDLIAGAPQEPCSITVDVAPAATITVSAAPAATLVVTVAPAATLAVAAAPAATIELDIAPAATLALSVWPT